MGCRPRSSRPRWSRRCSTSCAKDRPKNHFTVGIDGRRHPAPASPTIPPSTSSPRRVTRAMFFGLGADGTVGANKNSIKIIGEDPAFHAQGYFVYDSKKSGSRTVSHLRFGPAPIRATYLIPQASFIGCHQFGFLEQIDVLGHAAPGAVFLLNSPHGPDEVWQQLPREVQAQIQRQAPALLRHRRLRGRARRRACAARSTRSCRPASSRSRACMPREQAIAKIKGAIEKTYGRKGGEVVAAELRRGRRRARPAARGRGPAAAGGRRGRGRRWCPTDAPAFVREVTATMMAGARRRAAGLGAAGGRHLAVGHRRLREAQHLARSCRCGSRTSASSAATAASSARTA